MHVPSTNRSKKEWKEAFVLGVGGVLPNRERSTPADRRVHRGYFKKPGEEDSGIRIIKILAISRFYSPSSELHIAEHTYTNTV